MRRAAALAAVGLLSACAGAPVTAPVEPYLAAPVATTAPAPAPIAIRPMGDDRRWLAMAHAELRPGLAAGLFDCALGARLSRAETPALTRLFARIQRDLDAAGAGRRSIGRLADPCLRASRAPIQTWPGRLPALGTAYAAILARAAPDRAQPLQTTGQAIVESTVLCGLATPEDAAQAMVLGQAVVDAAARTPDFEADMTAARAEIATVRASGLTSPACPAERRALAQ